jgi:hypothetical protein
MLLLPQSKSFGIAEVSTDTSKEDSSASHPMAVGVNEFPDASSLSRQRPLITAQFAMDYANNEVTDNRL